MRLQFAGQRRPVVGADIELQLVDVETGHPVPAGSGILEGVALEKRYRESLYQSLILVRTDLHESVQEAMDQLHRLVRQLRAECAAQGIALLASGTHPTASWRDLHLSQSRPAQAFVRRLQWIGRRAAVFGARLHVGVPDGEKAIAIGGALTTLVPLLVALSASSPFWSGHDTGLASCRTRIVENIPNAGLPPLLVNFGEFQAYVRTLRAAESIERLSDIWWDVRPNLSRGTLEIQACDMPQTLHEVGALLALVQALVVWMLRQYEGGEVIPHQDLWIIKENKWRATRFGVGAQLVINSEGRLASVREYFDIVCSRLESIVHEFGLVPQFRVLDELIRSGPGYARQRRAFDKHGLKNVVDSLMAEFGQDLASH